MGWIIGIMILVLVLIGYSILVVGAKADEEIEDLFEERWNE